MPGILEKKNMKIGEHIDDLVEQREKMRTIQKNLDELKSIYERDIIQILEMLDEQGLPKASGKIGTISVKETTVAHVIDWDKVYNYILRSKNFHLMQRRISDGAFREQLNLRKGKRIPGIESFVKRGINLRNTKA